MTVGATTLTRRNVHQVSAIERTANAPWWVQEVETFLLVDAPKQILSRTGSGLLVHDDDVLVAVAAHRPHHKWTAELLQAFLVLPALRNKGLAAPALRCALAHVHVVAKVEHVMWLVHQENTAMLRVSTSIADPAAPADIDGFVTFAEP